MAMAVAATAPATQPSWNRVSKRANERARVAIGACVCDHRVEALAGDGGDAAEHQATPAARSDVTGPRALNASTTARAASAPAVRRSSPKRRRSSGATALPAYVPTP